MDEDEGPPSGSAVPEPFTRPGLVDPAAAASTPFRPWLARSPARDAASARWGPAHQSAIPAAAADAGAGSEQRAPREIDDWGGATATESFLRRELEASRRLRERERRTASAQLEQVRAEAARTQAELAEQLTELTAMLDAQRAASGKLQAELKAMAGSAQRQIESLRREHARRAEAWHAEAEQREAALRAQLAQQALQAQQAQQAAPRARPRPGPSARD